MAMNLDQLTASLYKDVYTPRTEEQLRQEAETRFQTQYNQQKLTAQQNYAAKDLAYEQQVKQLQDSLAVGQRSIAQDTASSIASANRYMITRGMQRSSYGAANQANLALKGQQNLLELQRQYDSNAAGVASNRALLAQQLADTLAQYDIDYLNDVQSYIDEQKQLDYDRHVASQQYANELNIQLYQLNQQAAARSGGGSSRRSSGGGSYTPTPTADNSSNNSDLWNSLTGTSKQQAVMGLNPTFGVASQSSTSPTTKSTQQKLTQAANEKAIAKYQAAGAKNKKQTTK